MHCRCYRPKAVVEYRRQAFVARENHIRITLDSQLTATESSFQLFSPRLPLYPVMDPFHMVLEVKYNGFLLSYIKDLLDLVERCPSSASGQPSRTPGTPSTSSGPSSSASAAGRGTISPPRLAAPLSSWCCWSWGASATTTGPC